MNKNLEVSAVPSEQYLSDELIQKITQCAVTTTLGIINDIQEEQLKQNPEFEEGPDVTPNEHIVNLILNKIDCDIFEILTEDDTEEDPWDSCKPMKFLTIYGESEPEHPVKKKLFNQIVKKTEYDNGLFTNKNCKFIAVWNEEYNAYQYYGLISLGTNFRKEERNIEVLNQAMNVIRNIESLSSMGVKNVRLVDYDSDFEQDVYGFLISWML